jgi:CheY-like chemotaxis protein
MVKRRALLVEENLDDFKLVKFLLENDGYTVLEAHTGQQALDIIHQELPDLILMALSQKGSDAWAAARQLKSDVETASIPLLALINVDNTDLPKRALDSGFLGIISKPINMIAFKANLLGLLQGGK